MTADVQVPRRARGVQLTAHALAGLAFAAPGLGLLGEQAWLVAKARLADTLIARAFAAHLTDGGEHRPWPWADTRPIARLEVPRIGVRRVVLAGATGPSLAFGPGHVDGTAAPGTAGNCAIAGHRDGSFAFLRDVRPGDGVRLVTRKGRFDYRVVSAERRSMWDAAALASSDAVQLTLITCWPFDGLTRGPWRFVVTCVANDA